ncbi:hypothetical protein KIPB_013092, partial [Kipferlia bialata]|eukprot:g13092.t1
MTECPDTGDCVLSIPTWLIRKRFSTLDALLTAVNAASDREWKQR